MTWTRNKNYFYFKSKAYYADYAPFNTSPLFLYEPHTYDNGAKREVRFRKAGNLLFIREIVVRELDREGVHIILEAGGFANEKLLSAIQRFFSAHEYSIPKERSLAYTFRIRSGQKSKFLNLFAYCNRLSNEIIFSNEIILEIAQLFDFYEFRRSPDFQSHIIPEHSNKGYTHTNPRLENSSEITRLLEQGKDKSLDLKALKKRLKMGDNVNQRTKGGLHPLYYASGWREENFAALKLLLYYGADPLQPDARDYMSELHNAFIHKDLLPETFTIMLAALSFLAKPVKPASEQLTILEMDTSPQATCILSHLYFSNQQIITSKIIVAQQISKIEEAALYVFFAEYYKATNVSDAAEQFARFRTYLVAPDKCVDLIYHHDRIIGFNLCQIIYPPRLSNHAIVHVEYVLIHPHYRGLDLTNLLALRLAYALQLILNKKHVGVFFTAVHYNAMRLITYEDEDGRPKTYLNFPKYQTPELQMLLEDILNHIYHGKYTLVQDEDGLICYVEENVHVKAPYTNGQPDFYRDVFYQYVMNIDPTQPPPIKVPAVPVIYMIGDENTANMTKVFQAYGLDFTACAEEFAKQAAPFLRRFCSRQAMVPYCSRQSLWGSSNERFWLARAETNDDKPQAKL